MMTRKIIAKGAGAILSLVVGGAYASCPPAGYDNVSLKELKADHWVMPNDRTRNALARALTDCLASPSQELRDGLAYEGLDHWIRNLQLDPETLLSLADNLQGRLSAPEGSGYERPFAALVLSDVARADRLHPFLSPERRRSLLDAALTWFVNIRDYRGYDDQDGWRHGVAHGADLLLQLSLNPTFGRTELTRIRDGLTKQISPLGHFYIYGEGERLAAPMVAIAKRNVFTESQWTAWFSEVATPAPMSSWDDAYSRNADLARLHNVRQFVQALYFLAKHDESTDVDAMMPGAESAIRLLP